MVQNEAVPGLKGALGERVLCCHQGDGHPSTGIGHLQVEKKGGGWDVLPLNHLFILQWHRCEKRCKWKNLFVFAVPSSLTLYSLALFLFEASALMSSEAPAGRSGLSPSTWRRTQRLWHHAHTEDLICSHKSLISPLTSSLSPPPPHRHKREPSRYAHCRGCPWRPGWPWASRSGCSGSHTTGKSPAQQEDKREGWTDIRIWCSRIYQVVPQPVEPAVADLFLLLTHISQVQDEAVSLVEAVPADRNLCRPDSAAAFDLKQPLHNHLVGDDMLKSRGHAPFLKDKIYF